MKVPDAKPFQAYWGSENMELLSKGGFANCQYLPYIWQNKLTFVGKQEATVWVRQDDVLATSMSDAHLGSIWWQWHTIANQVPWTRQVCECAAQGRTITCAKGS
jgi:hypothetical protein